MKYTLHMTIELSILKSSNADNNNNNIILNETTIMLINVVELSGVELSKHGLAECFAWRQEKRTNRLESESDFRKLGDMNHGGRRQ